MADNIIGTEDVLELNGYLKNMSSRMLVLKDIVGELEASNEKRDFDISARKRILSDELGDMKKEIAGIKGQVGLVQKSIISLISDLKDSVKADDMRRFERRIDTWAPESMVTRKETRKVIGRIGRI